jgi:hypothetical protein
VTTWALDPATGAVTGTRVFSAAGTDPAVDWEVPGTEWRQAFNTSFTELAATSPQQADGTTTAGYADTSGVYTALTGPNTGYAAASEDAVGFNPSTGDFWYVIPQGNNGNGEFGYTSQQSSHPANHLVPQLPTNGSFYYFAPGGWGPISADLGTVTPSTVYLPGGTEVRYNPSDSPDSGYQVGPYGRIGADSPTLPMSDPNASAWPLAAVNGKSFVAMDSGESELYLCTIGAHSVSVRPLLPSSTRTLTGEVAVDPSQDTVAFIATSGSQYSLYTISLTGTSQPRLVTNLSPDMSDLGLKLIAWVN